MLQKKLHTFEDDDGLSIVYYWRNTHTHVIFLAGIVFSFLTVYFWFLRHGFVIPSAVAAIISFYHSIRNLFNRTYIDVTYDDICIRHAPFSLQREKRIPIGSVRQLYVAQRGATENNMHFQIRAQLANGQDINFITIDDIQAEDAKLIEEYLEEYIGIMDVPVAGEYISPNENSGMYRRKVFAHPYFYELYELEIGDHIDWQEETYRIVNKEQYDWSDKYSDKYFRLFNLDGEKSLFLWQHNGKVEPILERKFSIEESMRFMLDDKNPPRTIELNNVKYTLKNNRSGHKFINTQQNGTPCRQLLYESLTKTQYIRIVIDKNTRAYFIGHKANMSAFKNIQKKTLDLNQLRKEKEYRVDWRDEDIV